MEELDDIYYQIHWLFDQDIYYQIHWLFDQIALLEVKVRELERGD